MGFVRQYNVVEHELPVNSLAPALAQDYGASFSANRPIDVSAGVYVKLLKTY